MVQRHMMAPETTGIKSLRPRDAVLLLGGSVLATLVILSVAGVNLSNVLTSVLREVSWEILLLSALVAYFGFRLVRAVEQIADSVE